MKRLTTEEFIQKAKAVHGDKYDYSETNYEKSAIKVKIFCKECGRFFYQTPNAHLAGHGCDYCARFVNRRLMSLTTEEFIERSKARYGDKFEYSGAIYKNINAPIMLICREHGPFLTRAGNHLYNTCGCPKCKSDILKAQRIGVGIYDGYSKSRSRCKTTWDNMMRRCYDRTALERNPTYEGCSVCEEWQTYSNFEKWFDDNYRDGCEIEKDIIKKGNKIYCPEYCCFVPRRINILLTSRKRFRGGTPVGVCRRESGRYSADLDMNGKRAHLGTFDTELEAFSVYKTAKENYIKEVAREYFERGEIDRRVFDALSNYKIEITD